MARFQVKDDPFGIVSVHLVIIDVDVDWNNTG
jgi:hypothetical protein